MNAKKCKRLRRSAEELTVGMPEVSYDEKRYKQAPILDVINGNEVLVPQPDHITLSVSKKSTRGVYLELKKLASQ